MESVRKARDVVMATTPDSLYSSSPDKGQRSFQQTQQTTMERDLFVPGETTLARSDEEICPLNIEEIRTLMRKPYSDIWKEMKGLRPTNLTKEMKGAIYPEVKKLLNTYWKGYKVHTKEIDLTYISGWYGSTEGGKVWLQLTTDDCNGVLLKQMAKDVHNLLQKCGYPSMHCIIMQDDYSTRTADYTISQLEGDELQKATQQPVNPNMARSTLNYARHFSLISGGAVGPCFEKPKTIQMNNVWEGTMAAYYTNGKHAIGISNSHVLGNQGDKQGEEYRNLGPSSSKNNYQMPANITYDRIRQELPQHIADLEAELATAHEYDDDERRRFETKKGQEALDEAVNLRNNILPKYNTMSQRRVGHSLWASGLTNIATEPFAVDVGVLLLDLEKGVIPQNKMPVVGNYAPSQLAGFMQLGNHATYPRLQFTEVNWVVFRPDQYVTRKIIMNPPAKYLDGNNDPAISTMKTGRTTGSTAAVLNDETSERSLLQPDSDLTWVKEYTATGIMGKDGPAFSAGGDSGSMCIVPDEDGRPLMLGLVTGGRGHTSRTDKTFIYPWFHFVESIMPKLVKEKILPKGLNNWSMNMEQLAVPPSA